MSIRDSEREFLSKGIILLFFVLIILLTHIIQHLVSSIPLIQGVKFQLIDQPRQALNWYNNVIQIDPQNGLANRYLGQQSFENGDLDRAIFYYNQAIVSGVNESLLNRELAHLYDLSGQYDLAGDLWDKSRFVFSLEEEKARQYFSDQNYRYAFRAFRRLTLQTAYTDYKFFFTTLISSILANSNETTHWIELIQRNNPEFQVFDIYKTEQIPGHHFHRIEPLVFAGEPLMGSSDGAGGSFNFVSGSAVLLLRVLEEDTYNIQADLRGGGILPVEMAAQIDNRARDYFAITSNIEFTRYQTDIRLTKGVHIFRIVFLPYEGQDDVSLRRFATIQNVIISRGASITQ